MLKFLKCVILLLADVFEKFRYDRLEIYGLCRRHYLSAPAISLNVMLNMLKAKFELVTDLDLHLSFEKGMGGEVSYASKRYSKFSHKYLKSYDPKQESKHIIKYGYVMSAFLLTS